MCINPFHPFTTRSRALPEDVDRSWIVSWLEPTATKARCEPSGDKLQKPSGSICGGPVLLPLLTSNRKVSRVFPFEMLYVQIVDGKRAHSTAKIATSWRTNRGGPPWMGIAKIEEGVSGPADLGVETYKISEPSGVTLGCESWSAAVTRLSANGRSVACLKISKVPFLF